MTEVPSYAPWSALTPTVDEPAQVMLRLQVIGSLVDRFPIAAEEALEALKADFPHLFKVRAPA